MSQEHEETGKMFVGGLSWESTQEALCRYFTRFGEVVDCVVMKNGETGRSRGFGFVTFKDSACVQIVLSSGPHNLDGRTIDPKSCNPRSMQRSKKGEHPKVFLGGLPSNITETDLRSYFSKFGKVIEVVIMYDQEKKRSRGFGFLSFEMEDSVDQVCSGQYVTINGKQVECKKAEPRDGKSGGGGGRSNNHWNGGGMHGGMPPPHMGGPPMGGHGMGPPQISNGMGYQQTGWGLPPQGGYSPQGHYGPPAASLGYQGWSTQNPYSPYGAPAYGPTPPYPYGYGYPWPGPAAPGTVASPIPVPGSGAAPLNDYAAQPTPAAAVGSPTTGANAQIPTTQSKDYSAYSSAGQGTLGAYVKEESGYGPSKTHSGQEGGSYGGHGDSPQSNNYSSSQSGSRGNGTHSQSYHPYRRQ